MGCGMTCSSEVLRPEAARLWRGAINVLLLAGARSWAGEQKLSPAPEVVGPVRQRAHIAVRALAGRERSLQPLVAKVCELVADARWRPTEAAVMRYRRGGGISTHRDHRRFVYAVAVVCLDGEGVFSTFASRPGRAVSEWRCRPGDVVVLAGPDPADPLGVDPRPLHAVRPAGAERVSLTFRMELAS